MQVNSTIPHSPFLDAWHQAMIYGAIVMCMVAALIYIFYQIRLASVRDYKERHDFINANEIKWYKYVFYAFGIAVAMIINLYAAGKVNEIGVWFFCQILYRHCWLNTRRLYIGAGSRILLSHCSETVSSVSGDTCHA
ncbi:MAG: hypothetical protein WDO15_26860 [Bacteroidota bacterium]